MKVSVLINMLTEIMHQYGDQIVTFRNGIEVGQVSAKHNTNGRWFTVEPLAFEGPNCIPLENSTVLQTVNQTTNHDH